MANSFSKTPNRIMQERANRAGLSENSVPEAFNKMAEAGEFPKARTYVVDDSIDADGTRTVVYFNRETQRWILQQSQGNKILNRFEADTQPGVYAKVYDYAREVEDANDPVVLICNCWLATTKWGKQFATFACAEAWAQLEKYVPADGVTIEALDHAFTTILDLNDHTKNWFRFEQKRDRLAREAAQKVAPTPHANLPVEDDARKAEDNANKALSTAELRRRALFGGRVKTTPSTGTIIRK